MKNLATLFTTLALAASTVLAQSITIGFPHDGNEFARGENIKLRVETDPNYDVQHLGITIVIEDCGNGYQEWSPNQSQRRHERDWAPKPDTERVCYADGEHGTVLYRGDFQPYYTEERPELGYHETFDVSIPWEFEFERGTNAAITVVHEYLVGYEGRYTYDFTSVNVRVRIERGLVSGVKSGQRIVDDHEKEVITSESRPRTRSGPGLGSLRSMLPSLELVRFSRTATDDEKVQLAIKSWLEADTLQNALNQHTCGIEKAFIFQGRKHLFNMNFSDISPRQIRKSVDSFNRNTAEEWC
ncbi:hypothetical protein Moror_11476 [Moniliophthora roreri MCA 2997]|uniref:Uncharacterized protein n=2 Tax=Moniliophthora roreri TaxID=221103 RepID=V2WV26_MONRO|nr:hypothetical protein Moror_11476 [Moniliophthora roreri MCA 2997]KAI3611333.1 hypothetical protein WG66_002220 [Moniliophthora roreri]